MKRFLKLMSFVLVFSFLWVNNTNNTKADINIKAPKSFTIYLSKSKKLSPQIFTDTGERIDVDSHNSTPIGDYDLRIDSVTWDRSNKNISLKKYKGKSINTACNYIKPLKPGKTKLTLTIKGADLYNTDYAGEDEPINHPTEYPFTIKQTIYVIVKRGYSSLRANGYLYDYDTRSNVFKVRFQNFSDKKVRIYSSGAYSLDVDYKNFDRKLKLTKGRKYVDILPNKRKNIYFKVKGNVTWYDIEDEEIHCICKLKKKKYTIAIDSEGIYKWSKGDWKDIGVY